MRKIKLYGLIVFLSVLSSSCSDQTDENVVFYSKDQLTNNIVVHVNNIEPRSMSVNSKTTLSLLSSNFFNENRSLLRQINISKISYKLKNFNSSVLVSNMKLFIDDTDITDYIDVSLLTSINNYKEFLIENEALYDLVATKLLDNNKVHISYKGNVDTAGDLEFDLEFSITAKGTFID
jgi:PBP1b-binding outer membrane lipoprotein LpoB